MPTRLLLEGPDIEVLLARVREEHGEQARIVQADKVRTGGIAGFFSRERYEVAIEVDDTPTRPTQPNLPTVTSLPILPRPTVDAPASILDLVEDIDFFERTPVPVPVPSGQDNEELSTSSDEFARVLARLAHDVGDARATAPVVRAFTPPHIPAPRVERGEDDANAPVFEPARFDTISLPDASTYRRKATSPVVELAVEIAPERKPELFSPGIVAPVVEAAPCLLFDSPLVHLGVPVSLAPPMAASEVLNTHAALARFVAQLPEAPRPLKGPGQITVVIGDNAYAAARQVARRARIDPEDVLLAAPATTDAGSHSRRDIAGPVHASRRLPAIRESETAVVIALEAAPGRDNETWTRDVIAALAPDAVWAVVDATRKTGDVRTQLAHLGHIDALLVERTEETADPASVLEFGIPVAQLDGRRATATAWSVLLGELLAHTPESAQTAQEGKQ